MAIIKSGGFFHPALHRAILKSRKGDVVYITESEKIKNHIYLENAITLRGSGKSSKKIYINDDSVGFIISEGATGDFVFENLEVELSSKCNFLVIPDQFSGRVVFKNVIFKFKSKVDPRDYYPIFSGNQFSRLDLVFVDSKIPYFNNSATTVEILNSEVGDMSSVDSKLFCERLSMDGVTSSRIHFESRYIDVPMKVNISRLSSITHTYFINVTGEMRDITLYELDDIYDFDTNKWDKLFKDSSLVLNQVLGYAFINCGDQVPLLIKNYKTGVSDDYPISQFLIDRSKMVFDEAVIDASPYVSRAVSSDLRFENSEDFSEWHTDDVTLSNQNSKGHLFDSKEGVSVSEGSALERLDKMIGLQNVKEQVRKMVGAAKLEAEKRRRGLVTTDDFSLHMVFGGRPGTGKTVVAKLLGEAMYEEGILPTKNFEVASRSDLVDDKVGGSALKTKAVIEKAIGGVLFIDEAYMLATQGDNDFADEVVAEIIQAAENNRDELIVIMAGYTKDMVHFFETGNEGLRSRFTNWIEFPDYKPVELYKILRFQLQGSDILLDEDSQEVLLSEFKRLLKAEMNRTGGYIDGNGRFVRNYKQELQMALSNRVADLLTSNPNIDDFVLKTLTVDDIKYATDHMISKL